MSIPELLNRFGWAIRQRFQVTPEGLVEIPRAPEITPSAPPQLAAPRTDEIPAMVVHINEPAGWPDERTALQLTGSSRLVQWLDTTPSPAPALPLPKALVAGPIIGWRAWRYCKSGRLRSWSHDTIWPCGEPMKADHGPEAYRSNGIYAMKTRDDLQGLDADELRDGKVIVGTVALWGAVIEHEKGYRAEWAYPVMLDLRIPPRPTPMPGFPVVRRENHRQKADLLRQRYGCEVLV